MGMLEFDNLVIFGTGGSGNQKKAWNGNYLIKLDSKYRESSKEHDAHIIARSFGLDSVEYVKSKCLYEGKERNCCICKSFLNSNEYSLTLMSVLDFYNVVIPMNMSAVEYFTISCNCIKSYTGLDAKQYLMNLLVFDYLIGNADRHLTNIEFIKGTDSFRFTPIFDNGHAFFKTDALLTGSQLESKYRQFKPLPFSRNPKKNLIDLNTAKGIANSFKASCGGFNNLRVSDARKKIISYMYNQLIK